VESVIRVPDPDDLEAFPVEFDRAGAPDVVSITAWEGDDTVRVTWDESRRTANMVWTKDHQEHLVAERSDVSEIIVRPLDDDHVELAVIWGASGEQRQLVARVMDPIDMTDTPLDAQASSR
jgi:hypothetical protein